MNTTSFFETIILVSGTVSIVYLLFLATALLYKALKTNPYNNINEGVSVIIAAHNELPNIQAFLPAILNQSYPQFEVIVACDRCTDGSIEFLHTIKDAKLHIVEIHSINHSIHPKKAALTQAIQKASFPWILTTDADCYPQSTEWINSMMKAKKQQEICLGFSFYIPKPSFLNLFIRFETLFTALQYGGWAVFGKPYMAVGRNLLYAKKLFINNSGFGKHAGHLGGDDDLLVQEIASGSNTTIAIDSKSITLSPPSEGFRQWWHQKHRHLNTGKQYPVWVLIGLSIYPITCLVFYLGIIYYIYMFNFEDILLFYILRTCIFICIFVSIGHRWNSKLFIPFLAFTELLYLIYLLFAGVYSLTVPIKKWK